MKTVVVAPNHRWFDEWRRNQYPPRPRKDYVVLTCAEDLRHLHRIPRHAIAEAIVLDFPVRPSDYEPIQSELRAKGLWP